MSRSDPAVDGEITVAGLPFVLRWDVPPVDWKLDADGRLHITAAARSDLFVEPGESDGPGRILDAPRLLGAPRARQPQASPETGWLLQARVSTSSRATFDAAALLVWLDDDHWAKLALEASPDGEPTIVSVVTREHSDDANAWAVASGEAWLRIANLGRDLAFHASDDGQTWRFVRHCSLGETTALRVGFLAQSPVGDGCTASFDGIRYEERRLRDLRNGD